MPRTYQCWDCGRTLYFERQVKRANITDTWGSKRVNLCHECFGKRETRSQYWGLASIGVAVGIGLAIIPHYL